ncbi:SHOCT domain-containing protein [Streptomyces rhizosphaerihabitans]|uniref:SHOCT domain-containing protein n=1 Tax=Streptomyces rhizosphaerihabitans TaxID=1266770 RepID=UPI003703E374
MPADGAGPPCQSAWSLFWALIITFGVLLFRALARPERTETPRTGAPSSGAEQLLAERFACGEIDEDEYHRRLAVLRHDDGPRLSKS